MAKSLDLIDSVQGFYQRYPQLGSSEAGWLASLQWNDRTVLDAGCGDGTILRTIHMHHKIRRGIGLDTSLDSLAVAARYGSPALKWMNGSIFDIPLPEGEVDDVLSIGVLHYFENPAPAIKEFARVVKPGGRIILFVYRPHPIHSIRQWLARLYGRKFERRLEAASSKEERNLIMNTIAPPPYWTLSRSSLYRFAADNELTLERIAYKPTHVPQLILRGPEDGNPGVVRRWLAGLAEILVKLDPLHIWSFGYYVIYRRQGVA